ncbi:peptidoglycan DD-metalloendopeptidase family protein [Paenibacillus apii]|uniref:peptidoglycan DD-metalloendopeptidase family protein n=1 Tax=Paenibacillus apii TaxID=1850370 RepID=UPI00143B9C92|nr:peptidoglycan DD-metalloendopeptidase family protein [Paenibacillus apii]NJJ41678.1 peptidoglycan DD-metalloendopeptidase family protein [Paenibacillus apii]
MGYKPNAGNHRKEHIRNWSGSKQDSPKQTLFGLSEDTGADDWRGFRDGNTGEPDPEKLWKERRKEWNDEGRREKPRFLSGLVRRLVISCLLFGAVWGIFGMQQPWAYRAQNFITDALSKDMDFASVRVWYDRYFDGAPAFIPIFGEGEEAARKASARHKLAPPVAGSIVKPFASSLKGIEIIPSPDSSGSVTVKSVDMGRVLSVSRETAGGIRVTVQHSGGIVAEYGHLSGTKRKADDWLQSGDTVGWMEESGASSTHLLYFSLMQDKTYIDPAEEIAFD